MATRFFLVETGDRGECDSHHDERGLVDRGAEGAGRACHGGGMGMGEGPWEIILHVGEEGKATDRAALLLAEIWAGRPAPITRLLRNP